jgi:hypothetical protein
MFLAHYCPCFKVKMQKLTITLLFALLALATATPMKFKKLTPINPVPQCSLLEVAACAGEIGGKPQLQTKL